jgi:hypothetical protein
MGRKGKLRSCSFANNRQEFQFLAHSSSPFQWTKALIQPSLEGFSYEPGNLFPGGQKSQTRMVQDLSKDNRCETYPDSDRELNVALALWRQNRQGSRWGLQFDQARFQQLLGIVQHIALQRLWLYLVAA